MRYFLCLFLLITPGCGPGKDHSHDPWLQHTVTSWAVTPAGHVRDAGPFQSVTDGWITEADIDAATDAGYARFALLFPEFPIGDHPFSINDDYVMWIPHAGWAGGVEYSGIGHVGVCMFTRGSTYTDPSPAFIVRPPGQDQWGNYHPDWRHTQAPLLPALPHELLHTVIGDPDHINPLWSRLQ